MMAAQASTSASTNGRIVTGTYSPDRRRGPSTSAMGSRRAAVVERRRWEAWAESNASMIVSAGTVLAPDRDLSPGYVVLEEGRIVRVAAGTPAPDAPGPAAAFPDGTLIPGLIDLQVNGGAGVDCLRCGPEGYEILGRYLAATGVTAYLPTIVSAPLEEMRRAAACAGAAAARLRPTVTRGVIAEFGRPRPGAIQLIARVAGPIRVGLVTDAISAAGMGRGSFTLGAQSVDVRDGVARLADGTLAGSVLAMIRGVHNFERAASLGLREAVQSATLVPARLLGLSRKGRIAAGCDADLVGLDREGDVALTLVSGEVAFRRGGRG